MRERAVVLGGGGHAKVVLDILGDADEIEVTGFTSAGGEPATLCGYRCLGTDAILDELLRSGVRCAFVAVGENRRRDACLRSVKEKGFQLINAISRRAIVSKHASLGEGVALMPGAIVNAGARLEDGVILNTNASVDHDCLVGRCAHIGPGTSIAGCVRVGAGALLGAGSAVVPGAVIGDWATIGAGAVVTADIPPGVVAVGVPAVVKPRQRARVESQAE